MKNNLLRNIIITSLMTTLLLGCQNNNVSNSDNNSTNTSTSDKTSDTNSYNELDKNTKAELWVMTWSGDGKDHLDVGNNPLPESEVNALNVGMLQGIAKAFNKVYPNIKINLHTEVDDPSSGGSNWTEKLINFAESHNGKYPDIWSAFNVIEDMNRGIVGDLSVFESDPDYKKINPNLMNLMNYYGFQAGLPSYAIPWGVYVNRELAEKNNIRKPSVDWTWDEYTDFVTAATSQAAAAKFCGAYDASMMMPRGAFIERQLQTTEKGSEYQVDFATDNFINAIKNLPDQSAASALGALSGKVDSDPAAKAFMEKGGYWGYNYFKDNMLLSYDGDPWMIFESNVVGSTNYINSNDWDIYPRPAFENEKGEIVVDNHIGVCLDPLVVYNYALDDKKPELSQAEFDKMKIAWTFAKFWIADTRAWEAKANSYFTATNVTTGELYSCPAINDTFPVVVQGEDFDRQMEIWFSTDNHKAYKDSTKFRGFNKVIELWQEGNIYGISDKAFPRYYHLDGDSTDYLILQKIDGFGNEELVGVSISDKENWISTYSALLRSINKEVNGWYNSAFSELKATLRKYYGWKN